MVTAAGGYAGCQGGIRAGVSISQGRETGQSRCLLRKRTSGSGFGARSTLPMTIIDSVNIAIQSEECQTCMCVFV